LLILRTCIFISFSTHLEVLRRLGGLVHRSRHTTTDAPFSTACDGWMDSCPCCVRTRHRHWAAHCWTFSAFLEDITTRISFFPAPLHALILLHACIFCTTIRGRHSSFSACANACSTDRTAASCLLFLIFFKCRCLLPAQLSFFLSYNHSFSLLLIAARDMVTGLPDCSAAASAAGFRSPAVSADPLLSAPGCITRPGPVLA